MAVPCWNCFQTKPDGGVCPFCGYDHEGAEKKHPLALKAGAILNGRYTVGRVLGQGGFGITYIAQDYQTKERVAIKEYFPSEFAGRSWQAASVQVHAEEQRENFAYGKAQFLEEAKTLAAFNGDAHIVRIYSYFEENSTAYFVMEYVDGAALDKYMAQRGGRLPVDEANRLLLPLMESLEKVHARGIIHRDIAPDNILVTKDGNAKLIDFGAARYSTGEKSKSLDVILKHGFAPKEQYLRRGKQGPFTDIYALAATYYYAVTGKVPPEAIERMDEDNLIPPSSLRIRIPVKTEDALFKALEVNAADRFQSMAEFRREMAAGRSTVPPTACGVGFQADRQDASSRTEARTEQEARERAERLERELLEAREEAARLEQERKEREAREEAERRAREAHEEAERREKERREREEKEKAARLERERKEREAREERERLERERREEEARQRAERLEQERLAREEAERLKRERAEQNAREEAERRERKRLERDKREEKKRAAAENKKQGGGRKNPAGLIAAVLVIAAAAAVVFGFVLPKQRAEKTEAAYRNALCLYQAGDYASAIPVLRELGEYADSAELLAEAEKAAAWQEGQQLCEDGKFAEAAAVFRNLGDYQDSAEKYKEARYLEAASLCELEQYDRAIPILRELGDYQDSTELLAEAEKGSAYLKAMDSYHAGDYTAAVRAFSEMPGYRDVNTLLLTDPRLTEAMRAENRENLRTVGASVLFGSYEQDNNPDNGKEPIAWIVLDVQEGKSLLISRFALDCRRYNTTWANTTWAACSLRKWLNEDFYSQVFSAEEQEAILLSTVDNNAAQGNPEWNTGGGGNTQDRLFLLSYTEAETLFASKEARAAQPTAWAKAQGAYTSGSRNCRWWLRSPGYFQSGAAGVRTDGSLGYSPYVDIDYIAVRPAFWINPESDLF